MVVLCKVSDVPSVLLTVAQLELSRSQVSTRIRECFDRAYTWLRSAPVTGTYVALESWCQQQDFRPSGQSWEVYGDWHEDPARLETEIVLRLCAAAERGD